jgi:prepilin-type N-terminal cleavage/methylation domain-containing protein
MLKSLCKKGFTLVEVVCSLGIFSILLICVISYEVTSLNIKKTIENTNQNVIIMETLKNNIIYSMTYKDLQKLQNDNRTFINSENISFDKAKGAKIDLFGSQAPVGYPYIQLSFLKCELEVYSLRLSLYVGNEANEKNISKLQCNFYKGNYK